MKIEELKKLRTLNATKEMMQKANADIPKMITIGYANRKSEKYKYGIYIRAQNLGSGYLKIALFLAEIMRTGSTSAAYEIFINPESGEFITYDVRLDKWRNAKIDNLDWPEYTCRSGRYINREANKSIKRVLGVTKGGYEGILEYQMKIREDELKNKHRRETLPWDLQQDTVPEEPKDFKKWIEKTAITYNFIFYNYEKKGTTHGYCTYCEKEVTIKKPKHNEFGKCICCGRKIQYKSKGKNKYYVETVRETAYLLQKCEDGFVLREYRIGKRFISGKIETPELTKYEIRRIFYNENLYGTVYRWDLYKNIELRWVRGNDVEGGYGNYYYEYYTNEGKVYGKTLKSIHEYIKTTGLEEMIKGVAKIDPKSYLASWHGNPIMEQMAKIGMFNMVFDINKHNIKVDYTKDTLAKKLGIDNAKLKRLKENNGGERYLRWLQHEKLMNTIIDNETISFYEKESIDPQELKMMKKLMTYQKIAKYLKKQNEVCGRNAKQLIGTWEDYYRMAKRLKMNVNKELIYKPNDLKKCHDELVELIEKKGMVIKAAEIEENYPLIEHNMAAVKEKYTYDDKKYTIVIPETIEQILEESASLRLCFDRDDRYFDRINRNESYLVFLRKTEDVNTPYYVIEIEPAGDVRQKRTLGDNQNTDIDEAVKFIKKWQQSILYKLNECDMELAELSKKLRNQNLQELRKTKTKIRSGILQGRLLYEVLEADLLEVM